MSASSNPLFRDQDHFDHIGNITAIWRDYTGDGVSVVVADDGVQGNHPDLDANYVDTPYNGAFGADTGQPAGADDNHGTSVAGIIAAEENNSGVVGVAYDASLTGLNIITNAPTLNHAADMIRYAGNFDVMNNSWGYAAGFNHLYTYNRAPENGGDTEGAAFVHIAETGRGGLGTVIVKSSGNEDASAQGEWGNNQHEIITVGAINVNGTAASYSNHGTGVLISAPAAEVTTDRTGGDGYGSTDYTRDFGGTSGSAPVVSGVAALMLEANPGLGWRDVQNILAMSASHTGSAMGAAQGTGEEGQWFANGADTWNGGGVSFNVTYGYGLVDVFAAVRFAEVWHLFEPAQTSANMRQVNASYNGAAQTIRDFSTTTFDINVTGNIDIEHIYVEFDASHTWIGDLEITLIAPDGTRYELLERDGGSANFDDWVFGVTAARGSTSRGTWQVEVRDQAGGDTGRINDIDLTFQGSSANANDVHHITSDFRSYAARDGARASLEDTNGGYDWLNLSAISGRVTLTMRDGGTLSVNGVRWASLNSRFEAAVLGDGADRVVGDDGANRVHAGRGRDSLYGNAGNDRLEGDAGNDTIWGDEGNDRLNGGTGVDYVNGGTGNDSLYGGAGSDRLFGGAGVDRIWGDAGNDSIYGDGSQDIIFTGDGVNIATGGDGNDVIYGGSGQDKLVGANDNDRLNGGGGTDRLFGGNGGDNIRGSNGNDSIWGEGGNDTLSGGNGNDNIVGGTGNDKLYGENGNDQLAGSAGNDLIYGGSGNDRIYGQDGRDRVFAGNDNDTVLGQNGNDVLDGGNGNDTVYGNAGQDVLLGQGGNDRLIGGDDNDTLRGGGGDDSLYGQSGNDSLSGDSGNDLIVGDTGTDQLDGGQGNDTMTGGTGADTFVFRDLSNGTDSITDFSTAQDTLRLDADIVTGSANGAAVVTNHASIQGGVVVLTFDDGSTVRLDGVTSTAGLADAIELF